MDRAIGMTCDGSVKSVIVGVGGFIGVGESDVAIDMSELNFVSEEGEDGDFFLVVSSSVAGIEDAPEYSFTRRADAAIQAETTAPLTAAANRPVMTAPSIEREGYVTTPVQDLTAADLTGARVYGLRDEDVGEISELILTNDGKMDRAVIDVGGFLGLGERPVR